MFSQSFHPSVPCFGNVPLANRTRFSYFECIGTLYHETLLDFSRCAKALAIMPERLPKTHMALVAKVNLVLTSYRVDFMKIWWHVWEALGRMTGLEWLNVELRFADLDDLHVWSGKECTLLEYVKIVTVRPRHFELILPWPASEETREEELPYTIRRVVDDRLEGLQSEGLYDGPLP